MHTTQIYGLQHNGNCSELQDKTIALYMREQCLSHAVDIANTAVYVTRVWAAYTNIMDTLRTRPNAKPPKPSTVRGRKAKLHKLLQSNIRVQVLLPPHAALLLIVLSQLEKSAHQAPPDPSAADMHALQAG